MSALLARTLGEPVRWRSPAAPTPACTPRAGGVVHDRRRRGGPSRSARSSTARSRPRCRGARRRRAGRLPRALLGHGPRVPVRDRHGSGSGPVHRAVRVAPARGAARPVDAPGRGNGGGGARLHVVLSPSRGRASPTRRDLQRVAVSREGEHVVLVFRANAFLHQMVRSLVGTLVRVGEGKLDRQTLGGSSPRATGRAPASRPGPRAHPRARGLRPPSVTRRRYPARRAMRFDARFRPRVTLVTGRPARADIPCYEDLLAQA